MFDPKPGLHSTQYQDDGEVGAEHALVLLDGPAAAEEGDDDDEDADDDQDDRSRRVDRDRRTTYRAFLQVTNCCKLMNLNIGSL
jgi:hypothetical protein